MVHSVFSNAKLLIFDLDGTLYEGTNHFDTYAKFISDHLSTKQKEQYDVIFHQVKNGIHPLKIGKVYDGINDLIWTWDPFTEKLVEARNWNNDRVEVSDAPEYLHVKDFFDFDSWVSIGDAWWPPYIIGRHFGLKSKEMFAAYNQTKVVMSKDASLLPHTPRLKDFLTSLKQQGRTLVLMTNSDEVDADRILKYLGLADIFEDRIPSAYKPISTKEHLLGLLEKYKTKPEDAVSIGDNFMNEIAPALQLGMQAIWISPDEPPITSEQLTTVQTLANLQE